MCLHTLQQEPMVAEEDIIIFKKLEQTDWDDTFTSPIQNFTYTLGETYKTNIQFADGGQFATVEEADWVDRLSEEEKMKLMIISTGFHASITDKILGYYGCVTVRGIVPKGSLYFTNHLGLITSDTIKLIEKVR